MFGAIQFVDFDAENGPAEAKKAWAEVKGWTGSSFKPIKYFGPQVCKGTNYWFMEEETVIGNPSTKKYVILAINSFQGHYAIIPSSIHEVKFEILKLSAESRSTWAAFLFWRNKSWAFRKF